MSTYGAGGKLDEGGRRLKRSTRREHIYIAISHIESYNFNIVLHEQKKKQTSLQFNAVCSMSKDVEC